MYKSLLAAFVGACIFGAPALAQVIPGGSGVQGSAQAGTAASGTPNNPGAGIVTGTPAATDPSNTANLGLGAVLRDAQAADPAYAGSTANAPGTKARAKARAQGH